MMALWQKHPSFDSTVAWKERPSGESCQIAMIADVTIEVYWKTDDSHTSLHWAGACAAPTLHQTNIRRIRSMIRAVLKLLLSLLVMILSSQPAGFPQGCPFFFEPVPEKQQDYRPSQNHKGQNHQKSLRPAGGCRKMAEAIWSSSSVQNEF
ncbi:MAG: hypothetical protein FWG10_01310 [Eubacteriaceae bacterium]|nr:hypothetical protein [Eubacteriaceae bacterium]